MARKKKRNNPNKELRNRAIKVRIYPTDEQKILFAKTFGCCRFVWNKMLSDENFFYEETDSHFVPTPAKYKSEFPFLKEVDSLALANVNLDLERAFSAFFKNSKHFGHPNFKSKKKGSRSYTTNNQFHKAGATIELVHRGIKLPKVGVVRTHIHRTPMPGWKLKAATVSQSASGKYFCSLLFEYAVDKPAEVLPVEETTIGLDYSSPSFYIDSNGNSADTTHYYRVAEDKLALYQRRRSKMQYGSKNYKEMSRKIALLHEHIANRRKDFAHKQSRKIANSYNAVCVEDINLRGMAGSLKLGKSTNDNGFGMFRDMLEYKLAEQGKHLIFLDKWFPSSKTCHHCGFINVDLQLNDRTWTCPSCGNTVNRDVNAAKNIRHFGVLQFYQLQNAS